MSKITTFTYSLAIGALLVGGCGGDDPVSVSEPIGINLKFKSGDSNMGAISDEKCITTESGNPWAAFISAARAEIGGDPTDIELDGLTLLLSTDSKAVTELKEIWNGTVDVQFEMNDTNNIFAVGNAVIDDTLAGRTAEFTPTFDFSLLNSADRDKLFNGSFKVMIGGPVATPFDSKGAEAEFQLTLEFSAFE